LHCFAPSALENGDLENGDVCIFVLFLSSAVRCGGRFADLIAEEPDPAKIAALRIQASP